ncbi:hypothetical protein CDG76_09630 [Nostoc sp. 'Peltigera membranacea cyanobiont' 210A]|uniref:hypothetical protein n=1 Tax=Nostoc sp. 'Peltigera membranacea cyanobiont' 210A TaxID=2014529 RepID=UPI000B9553C4|nr:hypothetical protein [Nostoc sp. 'Peltigera membranacea cyanobiont' 210A]OYD95240.1 hypothetical protein CDG76_09630 [Nostoc sp. 'Peltigera membranacea cyanobiont' 210A]
MIISDLNYLEITSEEIIGGGKYKPNYYKPNYKKPKFFNKAVADAVADAKGGTTNIAETFTSAVTTATSASAQSSSLAITKG